MGSINGLDASGAKGAPAPAFGRRAVLSGLTAALIAGSQLGRARATTAALAVGPAHVETTSDGTLASSLDFMLPGRSRAELEPVFAADGVTAESRPIPIHVSIVRVGDEVILIDAGSGSSFQDTAGKLVENLEVKGVSPAAVTRVILTHGHPDHLWGLIDDFDDSERFPNASYVVPAAEWDFWTQDDIETRVPDWSQGMAIGTRRVLKRLEGKLERRQPGASVGPGLSYLATPGHTPGHASVLVSSGRDQLLIGGDALSHPTIAFRRPAWPFGSDLDRGLAIRTRLALLDRLAQDRITLIGYHLPGSGVGRVERSGDSYRFVSA